ncbi:MAG: DoxX family protein [Leptolyngbyaceae cyanobacterium T60_A2020_046]|nr:DoxX family protein [Leptolyngbyaceae cyanobacterium T60_A2020_046]
MSSNRSMPTIALRSSDIAIAYGLLRLIMGINYFNHGFVRIGNIPGFMDAMVGAMDGAWMPEFLVPINAALVPPVELIAGALLIVGLFTRGALIATLILMAILMYGVTIVQNWDTASSQLIYNIVLFILLAGLAYNRYSLDYWIWGRKPETEGEPEASRDRPMANLLQATRHRFSRPGRARKHGASLRLR